MSIFGMSGLRHCHGRLAALETALFLHPGGFYRQEGIATKRVLPPRGYCHQEGIATKRLLPPRGYCHQDQEVIATAKYLLYFILNYLIYIYLIFSVDIMQPPPCQFTQQPQ